MIPDKYRKLSFLGAICSAYMLVPERKVEAIVLFIEPMWGTILYGVGPVDKRPSND